MHFDTQKRQVGKRPVRSSTDQTKVYVTSQRLASFIMRSGIGVIKRYIPSCGSNIGVYGTDKWEIDAEPMEMFPAVIVRPDHVIVTASIRTNDVIGLCVATRQL